MTDYEVLATMLIKTDHNIKVEAHPTDKSKSIYFGEIWIAFNPDGSLRFISTNI